MLPTLCLALVIASLTAYAVLGGADLGAGLWDLTAGGPHRGARVRGMVQRSMSPVWEANHVWVPFVLVVLWTAFRVFFGSVTSSLYVPLFLAAAGLIFRGTAFALRGQAATVNEAQLLGGAFALSSVVVPFCLGAAIGAVASGRVPVGNAVAPPFASWLTPTSAMIGALAVCVGAYLAAVYLAADAVRAGLPDLAEAFRIRALGAGVVTGAVALGTLPVVNADAPYLYRGLTTGGGLAWVVLSAVAGAAILALVRIRRYGPARVSAAAAVAAPPAHPRRRRCRPQHPGRLAGQRRDRHGRADPVPRPALPPRAARPSRPAVRTARPTLPPAHRRRPPGPGHAMTRPGRRLPTATVASLLLGLALMLPFDAAVTRVLGVTLLLTFVACGTWLVADPAFLTHDGDDGRLRGGGGGVRGPSHQPRAGAD